MLSVMLTVKRTGTPTLLATVFMATTLLTSGAAGQSDVIETKRAQVKADATAARATWKRFEATFAKKEGDRFLVKKLFVEGKAKDKLEELLWLTVTGLKDGKVTALVANRPVVVRNTKMRATVTFPASEIMDWLVMKNRQNYAGGYSLRDAEPYRSMRHEADRANLPFFLLDDFLAGLDLRGPRPGKDLKSFKKTTWMRIWVELKRSGTVEKELKAREEQYGKDFDEIVIPRSEITILLTRKGKPNTTTYKLKSEAKAGFARGELLFKIHPKAREFYRKEKNAHFLGMMWVSVDEKGVPTYIANTNAK